MKRNRIFGDRRHDIEVRDALRRHLRQGRSALRRVRCDFVDGCAILCGSVNSESERRRAEELAFRQPAVESVDNRIAVEPAVLAAG